MRVAISHRTKAALGAIALLVSCVCAFAQTVAQQTAGQTADTSVNYAIGVRDGLSDLRAAWTLSISGEWATQCPPTLEKVSLENATPNGADLRVDARSVLSLCARRAMPFAIEVNPALAMDRTALPAGVYHVSFYAADGAQAQPNLRAFALVDRSGASVARIEPETGFWWTAANTDESGSNRTVLSLELQNRQLSVALMTYDNYGQPVWHFGAAPYAGRVAHVPLLRLQGGGDPFSAVSSAPHGESTLMLDLQFQSGARASAWLSRVHSEDGSLQLQSFDLVRLPLTEVADGHAWQGDWVLVDDATATTQRVRLDHFQAIDAEHFQLDDSTSGLSLSCSRDAAKPEMPPLSCSLRQPNSADVSQFDSVAIARMDGTHVAGAAIHFLRITP
jgi:hypothetical protein